MIDIEKYGNTGRRWNIEPNGWQIYAYCGNNICSMDSPNPADAQLVADAPLLLAEVKRLRGLLDAIHWDAFAEDDTTLEIDRQVAERIRRGD